MTGVIYKSPLPDVVIPDMALTPFVFQNAAQRGDKVAFHWVANSAQNGWNR